MVSITACKNLHGTRVFVRASLDVPIQDGIVTNSFRITQSLPTLKFLLENGARVIIATHVGRDPKNTTLPIIAELSKHIAVTHVPAVIGNVVEEAVSVLQPGNAILLENLRLHPEEEENEAKFAEMLASYADIYVDDAFAVAHRAHASIVGMSAHLPSYAGITFTHEKEELSRAFTPLHPSLFLLGGAKFETKIPLIERFLDLYTHTFIGGALAHDFLKAKGYEIGTSLASSETFTRHELLNHPRLILPIDAIVLGEQGTRVSRIEKVMPSEKIVDVGPETVTLLASHIKDARSILWNGPLGYYEGGYDTSTKTCAQDIGNSDAYSVVGGGDTVASIESLGIESSFGFLSTAGGAMLDFLEKGTLPGIDVLETAEADDLQGDPTSGR